MKLQIISINPQYQLSKLDKKITAFNKEELIDYILIWLFFEFK